MQGIEVGLFVKVEENDFGLILGEHAYKVADI